MNNQQDSQGVGSGVAAANGSGVGHSLRAAREQAGLSVNEVANRIKFAPKQIEWLEADDFERLPEAAFVRGFVRSYSRLVGLDPAGLLDKLPSSHVQAAAAADVKSVEVAMPTALSARRHNIIWLAAALVVAVLLAIFDRSQDRAPEPSANAARVKVEPLELPNPPGPGDVAAPATVNDDASGQAKTEQAVVPVQKTAAVAPPVVPQSVRITPTPVPVPPAPAVQQPVRPAVATPPAAAVAPKADASKETAAKASAPKTSSISIPLPWQMAAQQSARNGAAKPAEKQSAKHAADSGAKPAADAGAADHALRLELDEDAWVEIKDSSGKVIVSKMHTAGSLLRVAGKSPLDISIGNAKAVRLFDNGKKINLTRYTTADVAHFKLK